MKNHSYKKLQSDKLMGVLSEGPWPDQSVLPGYNLIIADAQRSFTVKGGPFFILSLEYFASLMGTVLTYFLVMVQLKE
jgi:hypothetical protein